MAMNNEEARQVIKDELAAYEERTYADLTSLIDEDFHHEKSGPSGALYQIQILILWDSKPGEVIRIIGSIDDGGWRAFVPLTESILKYPPAAE